MGGTDKCKILSFDFDLDKNLTTANCIVFKAVDGKLVYDRVQPEEIGSSKREQYMLRTAVTANIPNATLTARLSETKNVKSTLKNKFYDWFVKNRKFAKKDGIPVDPLVILLENAFNASDDTRNKIVADVTEQVKCMKHHESGILTIAIDYGAAQLTYVGDMPFSKTAFLREYENPSDYQSPENYSCSCCHKKTKVFGCVTPGRALHFYNGDKQTYIPNGGRKEDAYLSFGLCKDCALDLEAGIWFLMKNLVFTLDGRDARYMLIPKVISGNDELLKNLLVRFQKFSTKSSASGRHEGIQNPDELLQESVTREQQILNMMETDPHALISYSMYFFDRPQTTTMRITDVIDNVSGIEAVEIMRAMNEANKYNVFGHEVFRSASAEGYPNTATLFRLGRNVRLALQPKDLANTKCAARDDSWTPTYYKLIRSAFDGEDVCEDILYDIAWKRCRDEWLEHIADRTTWTVEEQGLQALSMLKFYSFRHQGYGNYTYSRRGNELTRFMDDMGMRTNAARAAFLTGIIVNSVLRYQYVRRGTKPFLENLKGMNLGQDDFEKVFQLAKLRLTQYGASSKEIKKLSLRAQKYFDNMASEEPESSAKMNVLMAAGMALGPYVTNVKGGELHGNTENKEADEIYDC